MHSPVTRILGFVLLLLAAISISLPVFMVVPIALHAPRTPISSVTIPSEPTLLSFESAWTRGRFAAYVRSSTIVATSVVVLVVLFSVLSGFALGSMDFVGRRLVFIVLLCCLVFPPEVGVVALFYDLRALGLDNTLFSLIAPQVAYGLLFGTVWMSAAIATMPSQYTDAAYIDGATRGQALLHVVVPTVFPAIIALAVLQFLFAWGEFLIPLVMVSDEELRTVPVGLTVFQSQRRHDYPSAAAAAIIASVPPVLVYALLQRWLFRNLPTARS